MLEQIISLIAPHSCIHCGQEGSLLCAEACLSLPPPKAVCYRCKLHVSGGLICKRCEPGAFLEDLRAATSYETYAKQLVAKLKFGRARAAALPMAQAMSSCALPTAAVITYVPTATSRVRLRGYDQSALLAKQLSKLTGLPYQPTLRRSGQQRQLGQGRNMRTQQLAQAFRVSGSAVYKDVSFILIDDVLTTGSTIEAAAKTLKLVGAKRVTGLVFAIA